METTKKKLAPFFVFLAGCCWGGIGVFTKTISKLGMNSFQMVAIRVVVSMITMFLFLLFMDKEKLKIHIKDIWYFIGTGIISLTFFNVCYFNAIEYTSLSVAAILLYTAPIFVMLMSAVFFQESITGKKIISLIFVFSGCVFVNNFFRGSSFHFMGCIMGLCSGFGYALYSIFSRIALRKYHPLTIIFYTFLTSSAATVPFSKPVTILRAFEGKTDMIIFCLIAGFITSTAAYILYTTGLAYMESGKASVIATVEPLVATLIGTILYDEKIGMTNAVGILLIVAGIVIINMKDGKRETPRFRILR